MLDFLQLYVLVAAAYSKSKNTLVSRQVSLVTYLYTTNELTSELFLCKEIELLMPLIEMHFVPDHTSLLRFSPPAHVSMLSEDGSTELPVALTLLLLFLSKHHLNPLSCTLNPSACAL